MKRLTEVIRILNAILMGISAGFALATNVRAYIQQVADEERDGIDVKLEDVFKATTSKAATQKRAE